MCGLVGLYRPDSRPVSEERLLAMRARIRHRGPDDEGALVEEHVGLGHVRLSILDLSPLAAQPMDSHCGRFAIAFNGEIFNFRELREELPGDVEIRSSGDTEVLLAHLARFGVETTLPKLEGQFAIALWDRKEKRLHLARDRHGIKPLYYTYGSEGELLFASETKALTDGPATPDLTSASAALLGLSVTWGEHTMLRGIRTVRPGEILAFHDGLEPRRSRFSDLLEWVDPTYHEELQRASPNEALERVEADLSTSLDYRMISDAPLACLVSGGVDSSLIATLASRRHPDMQAYHADVEHDSERDAAEALAKELGLELHTVKVTDRDFLESVAPVTWFNDLPIIYHMNSLPFFKVSELAGRDGIKVLLTGEGSDEYFLGYPQYALRPVMEVVDGVRGTLQGALHRLSPKLGALLWPRIGDRYPTQLQTLVFRAEEQILADRNGRASEHVRRHRDRDSQTLTLTLIQEHLLSLLHRNDRLGMAWGLESRFPFLGHALARTAINLPGRFKLRKTPRFHDWRHPFVIDKWAVRELADRELPKALSQRRKRGFPVSVHRRFTINSSLFADGFVEAWFGVEPAALDRIRESSTPLWMTRLMLLEVWGRLFVCGMTRDEVTEHLLRHVEMRTTTA